MVPEGEELLWALAGNVVVGVGAGTATVAAFTPSLPAVPSHWTVRVAIISVGFAVFFAGYRLSQAGTHRDPDESLVESLTPDATTRGGDAPSATSIAGFQVLRGAFLVLGIVGLGAGMRLFALTIQTWSGTLGIATGLVCIGGYICGHIGMNGVII